MIAPPAVIDTNVLVAGVLTADPEAPTARIVQAMLEARIVFLLSLDLLDEYRRVLLRPAIREQHGLDEDQIDALLLGLIRSGAVREPSPAASDAPDPGDQHLWDLLATHAEALLVTGDRRLREQAPATASVIGPTEFARMISS